MTISSTTVVTRTNTNGSSHTFNFGHPFLDPDDLTVYLVTTATWAVELQVRDTDYEVSNNGNEDEVGGTVTFIDEVQAPSAPASGKVVVILREPDLTQDYNPGSTFEASQGETALDRIYQLLQFVEWRTDRSIRLGDAHADATLEIPNVTDRASKALVFDADGNLTVGTTGADVLADAEAAAAAALASQNAAGVFASAAGASASAADVSADLAEAWATKINGIVGGTDYSSKAWAIGGTDVSQTAARGAAKEWAIRTAGPVDTDEGSAKGYAVGATGVSGVAGRGAAKEWATKIDGAVDTAEYSAKAYAIGGTDIDVGAGSAKDWATKPSGNVGGTALKSALQYAQDADASAQAAALASENPAVAFQFDSATADADPGNGEFRFNNASPASATFIYFDNLDWHGNTVTGLLDFFDNSVNTDGRGIIVIRDVTDQTAIAAFNITGAVVDGAGYRKVPVTNIFAGAGTFSGVCAVLFSPAGPEMDAASILAALVTVDGAGSGLDADLLDGQSSAFYATASSVSDHINDTTAAHAASAISYGGGTGMSATDVEAAIDELATEKANAAVTLTAGNGLTGGGDLSANRTFDVVGGTGIVANANDVAVDKASDANIRAATSNKVVTADNIETASALVTVTSTTNATAVDWDAGINFTLTTSENTTISNPTNGQVGTWRTIFVAGNDANARTITFGNQFLGELPTITDATSTKKYLLMIYCLTTSHFVVSSKRALG
jgi:hypothetical protein